MKYLNSAAVPLKNTVFQVFNREIVWDEACYRTAQYFEKVGEFGRAETTYRAIIEEYPYNYYAHYQLARLYKDTGKLSQARNHYHISLRSKPDYLFSRLELGLIEINNGHFDKAIEHLQRARELSGSEQSKSVLATIYYGLSAAYANRRNMQPALEYANKSLQLLPSYTAAQLLKKQIIKEMSDDSSTK